MGKPETRENTRHIRKYPKYLKYPEIPESKKDTRNYPIVFFDTSTRPEPDPLPGILSNTRPDPIMKNPTRWALVVITPHLSKQLQANSSSKHWEKTHSMQNQFEYSVDAA